MKMDCPYFLLTACNLLCGSYTSNSMNHEARRSLSANQRRSGARAAGTIQGRGAARSTLTNQIRSTARTATSNQIRGATRLATANQLRRTAGTTTARRTVTTEVGGRTQSDRQANSQTGRIIRMQATRATNENGRERNQENRARQTQARETIRTRDTQTNTAATEPIANTVETIRQRSSAESSSGVTRTRASGRTEQNTNFAIVPVNLGTLDATEQDSRRPVLAIVPLENNAEPADFVNFARTIPRSVLQHANPSSANQRTTNQGTTP